MEKIHLIIVARLDEVPTFGQFTITSLTRDFTFFSEYKPSKYIENFIASLEAKQILIENIVYPKQLTAELKLITIRLTNNVLSLRGYMNLLEGYVVDAVDLTVGVKDFGISEVRVKVASMDVEGLNGKLGLLLSNIDANFDALEAVGYKTTDRTALGDLRTAIMQDKGAQNTKEGARAELVESNIGKINEYMVDIKSIWADGKRLFKINNKVKLPDYTNSAILKRIRHDELHTMIMGKVINAAGEIESGAKIKARPVLVGKRGKTVKSDTDGNYELKGLRPISHLITVTLKNGGVFIVSVEAVTNTRVVKDLVEP